MDIILVGEGKIFESKVDNTTKTESEILENVSGCKKIKPKMVKCEKEKDWDNAYDIILHHQKLYIDELQKAQYEKEKLYERKLKEIAM